MKRSTSVEEGISPPVCTFRERRASLQQQKTFKQPLQTNRNYDLRHRKYDLRHRTDRKIYMLQP
jgi:hypothetical protein